MRAVAFYNSVHHVLLRGTCAVLAVKLEAEGEVPLCT